MVNHMALLKIQTFCRELDCDSSYRYVETFEEFNIILDDIENLNIDSETVSGLFLALSKYTDFVKNEFIRILIRHCSQSDKINILFQSLEYVQKHIGFTTSTKNHVLNIVYVFADYSNLYNIVHEILKMLKIIQCSQNFDYTKINFAILFKINTFLNFNEECMHKCMKLSEWIKIKTEIIESIIKIFTRFFLWGNKETENYVNTLDHMHAKCRFLVLAQLSLRECQDIMSQPLYSSTSNALNSSNDHRIKLIQFHLQLWNHCLTYFQSECKNYVIINNDTTLNDHNNQENFIDNSNNIKTYTDVFNHGIYTYCQHLLFLNPGSSVITPNSADTMLAETHEIYDSNQTAKTPNKTRINKGNVTPLNAATKKQSTIGYSGQNVSLNVHISHQMLTKFRTLMCEHCLEIMGKFMVEPTHSSASLNKFFDWIIKLILSQNGVPLTYVADFVYECIGSPIITTKICKNNFNETQNINCSDEQDELYTNQNKPGDWTITSSRHLLKLILCANIIVSTKNHNLRHRWISCLNKFVQNYMTVGPSKLSDDPCTPLSHIDTLMAHKKLSKEKTSLKHSTEVNDFSLLKSLIPPPPLNIIPTDNILNNNNNNLSPNNETNDNIFEENDEKAAEKRDTIDQNFECDIDNNDETIQENLDQSTLSITEQLIKEYLIENPNVSATHDKKDVSLNSEDSENDDNLTRPRRKKLQKLIPPIKKVSDINSQNDDFPTPSSEKHKLKFMDLVNPLFLGHASHFMPHHIDYSNINVDNEKHSTYEEKYFLPELLEFMEWKLRHETLFYIKRAVIECIEHLILHILHSIDITNRDKSRQLNQNYDQNCLSNTVTRDNTFLRPEIMDCLQKMNLLETLYQIPLTDNTLLVRRQCINTLTNLVIADYTTALKTRHFVKNYKSESSFLNSNKNNYNVEIWLKCMLLLYGDSKATSGGAEKSCGQHANVSDLINSCLKQHVFEPLLMMRSTPEKSHKFSNAQVQFAWDCLYTFVEQIMTTINNCHISTQNKQKLNNVSFESKKHHLQIISNESFTLPMSSPWLNLFRLAFATYCTEKWPHSSIDEINLDFASIQQTFYINVQLMNPKNPYFKSAWFMVTVLFEIQPQFDVILLNEDVIDFEMFLGQYANKYLISPLTLLLNHYTQALVTNDKNNNIIEYNTNNDNNTTIINNIQEILNLYHTLIPYGKDEKCSMALKSFEKRDVFLPCQTVIYIWETLSNIAFHLTMVCVIRILHQEPTAKFQDNNIYIKIDEFIINSFLMKLLKILTGILIGGYEQRLDSTFCLALLSNVNMIYHGMQNLIQALDKIKGHHNIKEATKWKEKLTYANDIIVGMINTCVERFHENIDLSSNQHSKNCLLTNTITLLTEMITFDFGIPNLIKHENLEAIYQALDRYVTNTIRDLENITKDGQVDINNDDDDLYCKKWYIRLKLFTLLGSFGRYQQSYAKRNLSNLLKVMKLSTNLALTEQIKYEERTFEPNKSIYFDERNLMYYIHALRNNIILDLLEYVKRYPSLTDPYIPSIIEAVMITQLLPNQHPSINNSCQLFQIAQYQTLTTFMDDVIDQGYVPITRSGILLSFIPFLTLVDTQESSSHINDLWITMNLRIKCMFDNLNILSGKSNYNAGYFFTTHFMDIILLLHGLIKPFKNLSNVSQSERESTTIVSENSNETFELPHEMENIYGNTRNLEKLFLHMGIPSRNKLHSKDRFYDDSQLYTKKQRFAVYLYGWKYLKVQQKLLVAYSLCTGLFIHILEILPQKCRPNIIKDMDEINQIKIMISMLNDILAILNFRDVLALFQEIRGMPNTKDNITPKIRKRAPKGTTPKHIKGERSKTQQKELISSHSIEGNSSGMEIIDAGADQSLENETKIQRIYKDLKDVLLPALLDLNNWRRKWKKQHGSIKIDSILILTLIDILSDE